MTLGAAGSLATINPALLGALSAEISNIYGQMYAMTQSKSTCEQHINPGSVLGAIIGGALAGPFKSALAFSLKVKELLKNSPA